MAATLGQRRRIDHRPFRVVEVAQACVRRIVPGVGAAILRWHQLHVAVAPRALHQVDAVLLGQIDLGGARRRGRQERQQEHEVDECREAHDYSLPTTAAPAIAISSSCAALAAPLTPIAPTTLPSTRIGIPPWSGVNGATAATSSIA